MSHLLGEYNTDIVFGSSGGVPFRACKVDAPESGSISKIYIYAHAVSSPANCKAGIYSDNAGNPGTHLGHSAEITISTTGLHELTLSTPIDVVKGTTYWIVYQFDASTVTVLLYSNNNGAKYKTSYTYDTWTDNPTGLSVHNYNYAGLYALIESGGGYTGGWDQDYDNEVVYTAVAYNLVAMRFKCHEDASPTVLHAYFKKHTTGGATECKIGIYNDNAGSVGTHIAHSGAIAVVDDTANPQYVEGEVSGVSLTKDSYYWIVCQANGNIDMTYHQYQPNKRGLHSTWTYDTWTDNPSLTITDQRRINRLYAETPVPTGVTWALTETLNVADSSDLTPSMIKKPVAGTVQIVDSFVLSPHYPWWDDRGITINPACCYVAESATLVTGLEHLEGQVVAILANGIVFDEQVVVNGQIDLGDYYSKVAVGLPYEADLETLKINFDPQNGGTVQGMRMKVGNVTFHLRDSKGGKIGPDENSLYNAFSRKAINEYSGDNIGEGDLYTGKIRMPLGGEYGYGGRVMVRQRDPLPLTIGSIIPEVNIGGLSR